MGGDQDVKHLNLKGTEDVSDDEDDIAIISDNLIGSQSPTSTVLQIGGTSCPSKWPIRLRPLTALTNADGSPPLGDEVEVENIISPEGMNNSPSNGGGNSANPTWRGGCRGIRDKLRFILDHKNLYQDVTFIVGKSSPIKISGHRLILRLGSPFLDRAFSGLDKRTGLTVLDGGEILVPEVEPFAFKYVIKYIYTDEFDSTGLVSSDIMLVLQAAKFFEVFDLVQDCVQSLKDNVSDENAVDLCELAGDIEDFELRDLAISHICRNAKFILPTPNFLKLTYSNLQLLVDSDDLEIDELSLFQAVLRWGRECCKGKGTSPSPDAIRTVLDNIIYKIRFPLMSAQEFTFEVVPTKILTSDETVEIYKCLCLTDSMREQLEPIMFSYKRRNHITIKSELKFKEESNEDNTSDKLNTDPADSPPCQATLAANSNEITETESEDASSQVSSVRSHGSSNRSSKKRPLVRSPSPSHSKSPKKSKPSPLSRTKPGPLTAKRKSIDSETAIHRRDTELDLNSFIQELGTHPKRKEVESIRFSQVVVTDHDRLQDNRVRLPKLKEFHLDIKITTLKHSQVNDLAAELILKKFLFFSIKVADSKNWGLENIWSLGINISIVINGITLLRIDHAGKGLIINKLKDVSTILSSVRGDSGVKSLVLSHQKFPDHADLFPSQTLERLVLLSINHIPDVNKFLKRFKRLRELCLLTTETKRIDLCNDLVSERLQKLAVGSTRFSFSLPAAHKNLEALFFWRCQWSTAFEENFHLLFPNLKKVSFFGSKTNPKLLKKILRIKSIEEIGCGSFDWGSSDSEDYREIKEIVRSTGLTENVQGFVLTKSQDDRTQWEGRKGSFEMSQEEIYKNFQFHHLYTNYDVFKG